MEENNKIDLSYFESDRNDRTTRFFGKDGFNKLQNSSILVVGAGAIGNEIIKNFALLGIKKVTLVDFDIVSKSNSNRCVFFREEDHNKIFKVDAIKKRVSEFSDMEIIGYNKRIEECPEEVWENLDLAILGVDNDYTRMLVNARMTALFLEEKTLPIINGAMGLTFIECEVLVPGITACLTCLWTDKYKNQLINREVVKSCDEFFIEVLPKFPAISTFTSVLGGIMVAEATKLLTLNSTEERFNQIGTGYLIRHDLDKYEYTKGSVLRNGKCTETFCRSTYNKEEYRKLFKI